ncbi:MAG: HigA family addiction module antidote protein [Prevotellaceae bacterium]|jgi:addiction module HigA family antidote|nr:HigA family addiction module antidote protein [Prevotellaceae bacterium]
MITIPGISSQMIANNLEPAYPTHPGEVLKEEIEYRGISQKSLAAEMNVPYTFLNEVLNAKRPVNTELALLIEAALDLPAEPILSMQSRYNMLITKRNNQFIEKLSKVRKMVAAL